MLIAASFRPPAELAASLLAAAQEAADAVLTAVAPPPGRHGLWRRSPAPVVDRRGPLLLPSPDPQILVTRFGNLTPQDYKRVLETLAAAGAGWSPATVHVAALRLDTEADPVTFRADLGGDVGGLDTIAREVALRAADLNLYVDRRLFRPWLRLATLDDATRDEVSALAARLPSAPEGTWTVDHLSVLRQTFDGGQAGFVEVERVPLVACS